MTASDPASCTVLGIDSSTTGCSVALWAGGEVRAWRACALGQAQSGALMPMIAEVLAAAGLTPPFLVPALGRIAVTIGPGSFTGVRVGLAAARGLALAVGCPVVGLTTTEVMAHGVPAEERKNRWILAAANSRRPEPFGQLFDSELVPYADPVTLTPETLAALLPSGPGLLAGDGAAALVALLAGRPEIGLASGDGLPDARLVARLGAGRPGIAGVDLHPLYIRPPDVTLPAPNRSSTYNPLSQLRPL